MKNWKFYFTIFSVLAVLYAYAIPNYASLTAAQAAYATIIVILGILPVVVLFGDKREAALIPLMPLHGLFYSLTFGLPAFSDKTQWFGEKGAITAPLLLTIVGLLCLYAGYYSLRGFWGSVRPIQSKPVPVKVQLRAAWILFSMYLIVRTTPNFSASPLSQLAAPLGYLSLGLLAMLALDRQLSRVHLLLFSLALCATMAIAVLSGALAQPVFFLVLFGILYWAKRRRVPWTVVLLSGLIALLLNPIKGRYRDLLWYIQDASYAEKAQILVTAAKDYYSDVSVFAKVSEDTSTVSRLAHIATLGYVVAKTPDPIPYWMGGSYHTLWTSFVPRLLWPGKPKATIGQDFGQRYEILRPDDDTTSFNLPWLVEFYANFGTLGVVGGMFFVGVFFRFLVQKFNVPPSSAVEYVLGVSLVFTLFYAESNFAIMVGGMLTTFVVSIVLLRMLTGGGSAAAPKHRP